MSLPLYGNDVTQHSQLWILTPGNLSHAPKQPGTLQIIDHPPPLIWAAGKATLIANDVKILCSRDAHYKDDILRFSQYIKETLKGRAPGLGVCPSCISKKHVKESLEAEKKRKRDEKEQMVSVSGVVGAGHGELRWTSCDESS